MFIYFFAKGEGGGIPTSSKIKMSLKNVILGRLIWQCIISNINLHKRELCDVNSHFDLWTVR